MYLDKYTMQILLKYSIILFFFKYVKHNEINSKAATISAKVLQRCYQ